MANHRTNLHDLEAVVSLGALKWAWLRVRENRGAAGGDGISLNRFERMLEANLIELADQARSGTYLPSPVRMVSIHKPPKTRRIAVLAVRDRVLQRSVLEYIDDHCDRQFLKCSYGYRSGKSLHQAVSRIVQLRDRGLTSVIDADIRACFGSLHHDMLKQVIDQMLPGLNATVRHLLHMWIDMKPRHTQTDAPPQGVLMGAPVAPLLCNMYLHQMDVQLTRKRYALIRYADDFVVLCPSIADARARLVTVRETLAAIGLELNPEKTRITSFAEGLDFLGVHFTENDYSYMVDDKRVVVTDGPPPWFYYHPERYDS